ncbi:McrB family protein [Psychromonas sp. Urea-02u-13]|uniref:McrB family protein n=1 Tax=Psychromonas sp. Urea-02u-13 TaxID=2058326 RepID=UPI000C34F464|nr:AAA family ATPase [Psychromonas sp. Urea-02u-13]PKG38324.1 hypothetical protein CXF74_14135 [Psychromonas sp. Urea-02u-13]
MTEINGFDEGSDQLYQTTDILSDIEKLGVSLWKNTALTENFKLNLFKNNTAKEVIKNQVLPIIEELVIRFSNVYIGSEDKKLKIYVDEVWLFEIQLTREVGIRVSLKRGAINIFSELNNLAGKHSELIQEKDLLRYKFDQIDNQDFISDFKNSICNIQFNTLSKCWVDILAKEAIPEKVSLDFWTKLDEIFTAKENLESFIKLKRMFLNLMKQLKLEANDISSVSCGSNQSNQMLFKADNQNLGGFKIIKDAMTIEFNLIAVLVKRIDFYGNISELAKSEGLTFLQEGSWFKVNINDENLPLIIKLLEHWFDKNRQKTSEQNMPASPENKYKVTSKSPLNEILFGPPGTGKTYHTIEAAVKAAEPESYAVFDGVTKEAVQNEGNTIRGCCSVFRQLLTDKYQQLIAEKQIQFVTFHQSYGYEEFVEGLKANSTDGEISYDVESGIFKKICEDARNADLDETGKPKKYVLIIDEINRGNISKIFGELITLIEPSKRAGNDEAIEVVLPNSSKPFSVPNNLHIIGTMNTADRSLAMMDTALRRRFDFKEMMPKPALFDDECGVIKGINLTELLTTLNKRIEVLHDREHTLGHAFLFPAYNAMVAGNENEAFIELQSAFQNKIIPLLEEYFYDDWNKISLVLGDNQRIKPSDLKFVQEQKIEYNDLFGGDYQSDEFGQPEKQYALAEFSDSVWSNNQAYQAIYATADK